MKQLYLRKSFILIIIAFVTTLASCSNEVHLHNHQAATDEAPLHEHDYTITSIPMTCDAPGYDIYTCSICNAQYSTNYTVTTGHTLSITNIPPTCNTEGYKTAECQACEYEFTYDVIAPTGHSFVASREQVSAQNQIGCTTYTCHCGFSYVGDYRFYSDIFSGAYVENTSILAKGIDVSYHNHNLADDGVSRLPLNWEEIRASDYDFAILRAGYSNKQDVCFEMNYADAKAAGLEIGAYFYSYATSASEARAEALFCLSLLDGKQFEYPIFFDIEDSALEKLGKDTVTEICITFISTLQENGYYAAIYTNNNWLINILHTDKIRTLFDVWYARYLSTTDIVTEAKWNTEKYGAQMAMWQFSQTGVIDGFLRPDGTPIYFDLNYAYKDYPALIKALGYNGY